MPFTGGASAPPEIPGVLAEGFLLAHRYQTLRQGQPMLTPRGRALLPRFAPVRKGYVRLIVEEGQPYSLDMLTTAEPYLLGESYAAGWDNAERPGRTDLPIWRRGGLLRQAIPVILTTLRWPNLDIEDEWRALRALARPANAKRPPVLRLAGPVDHKELQWVIVGLEIDAESTKRRGHKMVRQQATITVQQWPGVKELTELKTTKAALDRPRKILTTADMNTPKKIAKRYGVSVKRLQELNLGLGDPDRKLPAKTEIWLPPLSAVGDQGSFTGGARAPS